MADDEVKVDELIEHAKEAGKATVEFGKKTGTLLVKATKFGIKNLTPILQKKIEQSQRLIEKTKGR